MNKVVIVLIIGLLCAIGTVFAGWTRTYGGDANDWGRGIQKTPDEGYIIAGYTSSFGAGYQDVYLIKINSDSDTLWTQTYGENEYNKAFSVSVTSDSGFIVAGETNSYPPGVEDAYLLRLNSSGDTLWTKTYHETEVENFHSALQTDDGGFICLGTTAWAFDFDSCAMWSPDSSNIYLVKIDEDGDVVWNRFYEGYGLATGYALDKTYDGGYVITGSTKNRETGEVDVYILKTDSSGDTIWTETCDISSEDEGRGIRQSPDGGFVITGWTHPGYPEDDPAIVIKLSTDGEFLWSYMYYGKEDAWGRGLEVNSDNSYIITGTTYDYDDYGNDVFLLKLDSFGDSMWARIYVDTSESGASSIVKTEDNGFIITGQTRRGSFGREVYVIKTDSLGYTGIDEKPSAKPAAFAISAYPNPFNGECKIMIDDCGMGIGAIEIFDVNGRLIYVIPDPDRESRVATEILDSRFHGNDKSVVWQPSPSLSSGVYLVRATVGDESVSKRIVYLK